MLDGLATAPASGYHSSGTGAGLYVCNPDMTPVASPDGDNVFKGGLTMATSPTYYSDPSRIRVAKDGRIFISRSSDQGGYLTVVPNHADLIANDKWNDLLEGYTFDAASYQYTDAEGNFIAASNVGLDLRGEGETLEIAALSANNSVFGFNTGGARVDTYALGNGTTLPVPTQVAGLSYWMNSHQCSNATIEPKSGGMWFSQYRGTPSNTQPALVYVNANGEQKLFEGEGGMVRGGGGLRFSPDGSQVAIASSKSEFTIYDLLYDSEGGVTLIANTVVKHGIGTNCYDIAWDLAGNIYICGNSGEWLKAFALPRSEAFTTKAAAQYKFEVEEKIAVEEGAVCFVAPQFTAVDGVRLLNADGSEKGDNSDVAKSLVGQSFINGNVTLDVVEGGPNNSIASEQQVRWYQGNIFNFTPAEGYVITKVFVQTVSGSKGAFTAEVGTVEGEGTSAEAPITWTGSSKETLALTAAKQVRFSYIAVTVEEAPEEPLALLETTPPAGATIADYSCLTFTFSEDLAYEVPATAAATLVDAQGNSYEVSFGVASYYYDEYDFYNSPDFYVLISDVLEPGEYTLTLAPNSVQAQSGKLYTEEIVLPFIVRAFAETVFTPANGEIVDSFKEIRIENTDGLVYMNEYNYPVFDAVLYYVVVAADPATEENEEVVEEVQRGLVPTEEDYQTYIVLGLNEEQTKIGTYRLYLPFGYYGETTQWIQNQELYHEIIVKEASGVEGIAVDAAKVRYYNAQGIEIPAENLENGVYLKVQGKKVQKVYVK